MMHPHTPRIQPNLLHNPIYITTRTLQCPLSSSHLRNLSLSSSPLPLHRPRRLLNHGSNHSSPSCFKLNRRFSRSLSTHPCNRPSNHPNRIWT
mmetsp:Transcript_52035/g.130675  ORF Transcript_52035/g.130675 Transcript_52035/m.130675 type:complete len:93 (-) Transcript_52035:724-1002(-)